MPRRFVIQSVAFLGVMAALLFVPAGTVAWPAAWVFVAELAVPSVLIGAWLARHDPALLAERMSGLFRPGQPRPGAHGGVSRSHGRLAGGDGGRRDAISPLARAGVAEGVGALAVALCFCLAFLTFRANTYAAAAVRVQAEREHRVVTDGPYAVV